MLLKNCGNVLDKNISLAVSTGQKFKNYKIVIYENNSTDNTKQVLKSHMDNSNIIVMSEDLSEQYIKEHSKIWTYTSVTGSDHPCRVEQICNARNKVLCEINKERYDKYEYVIWIDMDSNGWDIDGIINSFTHKGWDVMYANGLENNSYYDLYAIRHSFSLFGPEIIGEKF